MRNIHQEKVNMIVKVSIIKNKIKRSIFIKINKIISLKI